MIGIDEVGRGCWAGPLLVVAARQHSELPKGLKDSKKLSKKQRELFKDDIEIACDLGEGWVTAKEIDQVGLTAAMNLAVVRAVTAIKAHPTEEIIMDGSVNYCSPKFTNVKCEPKADDTYPIVSAASIYAKVTRDSFMAGLADSYKKYKFSAHVGYGTTLHRQMLKQYGPCDLHRLSFEPLKQFATL